MAGLEPTTFCARVKSIAIEPWKLSLRKRVIFTNNNTFTGELSWLKGYAFDSGAEGCGFKPSHFHTTFDILF